MDSPLQILKAICQEVNLSYQSSLLKHPTRRQNFAYTLQPHCAHYLTLRLRGAASIQDDNDDHNNGDGDNNDDDGR